MLEDIYDEYYLFVNFDTLPFLKVHFIYIIHLFIISYFIVYRPHMTQTPEPIPS